MKLSDFTIIGIYMCRYAEYVLCYRLVFLLVVLTRFIIIHIIRYFIYIALTIKPRKPSYLRII